MPAAFSDSPNVDQSQGSHPSHTGQGSRFNDPDSRGPVVLGANVTEAIAEFKRGTFSADDLKALAFAMGYQIIGGKDTAALAGQITELKAQLANALHRAEMAEGAYRGKNEISDESFAAMATKGGFLSKADSDALTARALAAETALSTTASALAAAQSDLATATARAETAEASLASANAPKTEPQ